MSGPFWGIALMTAQYIGHDIGVAAPCGIHYAFGGVGRDIKELPIGIDHRAIAAQRQQHLTNAPPRQHLAGSVLIGLSREGFYLMFVHFEDIYVLQGFEFVGPVTSIDLLSTHLAQVALSIHHQRGVSRELPQDRKVKIIGQ